MGKKKRIKELERRLQGIERDMALLKSLGVELPTTIDVEHEQVVGDQLLTVEDAMSEVMG